MSRWDNRYIKYLGLISDIWWSFGAHFVQLVPRVRGVPVMLHRLSTTQGGPREEVHSLVQYKDLACILV